MNFARFSVARPVAATIISVSLFLMGLFFLQRMPVSLYPDVSFPFIAITMPYPGASPEQVEAKIIKPLEKELSGIKNLDRIIVKTVPNAAVVVLAFGLNANEQEAIDAVREKVSIVRESFPTGVHEPIVQRIDFGATPILIYGIRSDKAPEETKRLLQNTLIRSLQRIEGVREAEVLGLGEERIELQLDAQKLSSLRVAPLEIFEILSGKMSLVPWGDVTNQNITMSVARSILPEDTTFWDKQEVVLRDSRSLTLGQIGSTHRIADELGTAVLINDKPGLGLIITKRADANTVDTIARVQQHISDEHNLGGIELFPIVDQANFINANAHEVWIALFVGGFFAVMVILFFLTDIKSALISATALPVSVAGSFIFMYMLGFSINMLTLLALALAIGLLIDDAVVVRESIYHELEKGKEGVKAAIDGTNKVASAVLATTLAVIAVFLPVALMGGLIGQFFKQFGLTICIAVAISLWVAFTLDPMLSAKFAGKPQPLRGPFWNYWRHLLDVLEEKVVKSAEWAFSNPLRVIAVAILMLVGSIVLSLRHGAEFLAPEDRGQFLVSMRLPAGSTKEQSIAVVQQANARLKDLPGLTDIFSTVSEKRDELHSVSRLVFVPKTQRKIGIFDLQKDARQRLQGLPADWMVMDPPTVEGLGNEAPISIYIYGDDLVKLRSTAEDVRKQVSNIPGVANVRIETANLAPSVNVTLNEKEVAYFGTTGQAVETTGRLALTGLEAGGVGPENTSFFVTLRKEDRNLNTVVRDILVPSGRGPESISRFALFEESLKPLAIEREKRNRKLVIFGTLDRTRAYGNVLEDVQKIVDKIPPPFSGEIAGDREFFEEMVDNFTIALVGSMFFIFIVLAIQFENVLRPFVILLSLPLAAIGGLLALYLTGWHLAMGAIIGFILLIGLAAKNGILLVDAIGFHEDELPLDEAVSASVRERSRPILMTSLAMIFGMIPTAILRGSGSEFRAPMAIAIIGGVISSTLLSFLVVPSIFGFIYKLRYKRGAVLGSQSLQYLFLGMLSTAALFYPNSAFAQNLSKKADMNQVRTIIRDIKPESAEDASIAAAEAGAEGLKDASRLALLGGARVEVAREWAFPGLTQTIVFPFPQPIGTVTQQMTVIPRSQNVATASWQIPVLNLQVLRSLRLASIIDSHLPNIRDAKKESATLSVAQLLFQYELALRTIEVNSQYVENAEARRKIVQEQKRAGSARAIDEGEATVATESARVALEQSKAEAVRLRETIKIQTGKEIPAEGLGTPSFPFKGNEPFAPVTLKALDAAYQMQFESVRINDASFFPNIALELAHQRKDFLVDTPPEPQNFVAIRAQWNILDGGTRVRQSGELLRSAYEALAQKRTLQTQLQAGYDTLKARFESLQKQFEALKLIQQAAARTLSQAQDAFRAGLATSTELRNAEEGKLKADFAVLQAEFGLQGLAMESLTLTGTWLNYLNTGA